MKQFGILLMIFTLAANLSHSQPTRREVDPEEMAKRQTEQLKEALDLNADQEKQVYELNLKTGKKMRSMREEMSAGSRPEGMREKMAAMREEQNAKMKEILNEAQWKKYEKYLEERRARWQQRRSGGRN